MNLPQGDVAQVDEVWLVLRWHAKQFQAVEELRSDEDECRGKGRDRARERDVDECGKRREVIKNDKFS